jgi:hypothetical protein
MVLDATHRPCKKYTAGFPLFVVNKSIHSPKFFVNFRNICVSVAVFRYILQNILQYMTKYRDTYTYITEIEKNLGECRLKYFEWSLSVCDLCGAIAECYLLSYFILN